MKRTTPWFPATQPPSRNGRYEVEYFFAGRKMFRDKIRWAGGGWTDQKPSYIFGCMHGDRWRGLIRATGAKA